MVFGGCEERGEFYLKLSRLFSKNKVEVFVWLARKSSLNFMQIKL